MHEGSNPSFSGMLYFHLYELRWRCYFFILSFIITLYILFLHINNICIFFIPLDLYFNNFFNIVWAPLKLAIYFSIYFNIPFLIWQVSHFLKSSLYYKDWINLKFNVNTFNSFFTFYVFVVFFINYTILNYFIKITLVWKTSVFHINSQENLTRFSCEQLNKSLVHDSTYADLYLFYSWNEFISYTLYVFAIILLFLYLILLGDYFFNYKLTVYVTMFLLINNFIADIFLSALIICLFIIIFEVTHLLHLILITIKKRINNVNF